MSKTRFARYEIVRKLASGGMADVSLARQSGDGGFQRDVVIKRLYSHLLENEKMRRLFLDEARLLASLSHPGIPQVYDFGEDETSWLIVMEHVDGYNVAELWKAGAEGGQVMPLNVAIGVVLQVCEALHHAHERHDAEGNPLRIVHRDVTPQNIMVTRDGVVKVLDFGVALTSARRETEAGAVRGTYGYMAPEQVRARQLDKRADVFAIGVVLYELTTGSRLYRGTDVQMMTAIVEEDAPAPTTRLPDYPPALERIVLAALARDRRRRIPSAGHLATQLEAYALAAGLSTGPRTIARHVQNAFPPEPSQHGERTGPTVSLPLEDRGDDDATRPGDKTFEIAKALSSFPSVNLDPVPEEEVIDDDSLEVDLRMLSEPLETDPGSSPPERGDDDEPDGRASPAAFLIPRPSAASLIPDPMDDADADAGDDGGEELGPYGFPIRPQSDHEVTAAALTLSLSDESDDDLDGDDADDVTGDESGSFVSHDEPTPIIDLSRIEGDEDDEDAPRDGPVVLLASPKKSPPKSDEESDYVDDLSRRLDSDESKPSGDA